MGNNSLNWNQLSVSTPNLHQTINSGNVGNHGNGVITSNAQGSLPFSVSTPKIDQINKRIHVCVFRMHF